MIGPVVIGPVSRVIVYQNADPGTALGEMSDLRRLGRREAYRLGTLRTQGVGQPAPPRLFRPSFQPRHRGPASAWFLGFLAGTAAVAAAAHAGLWFVAFLVGLLAGFCGRLGRWRLRVILPAAAAMAVIGWAITLGLAARRYGLTRATAHVATVLPGLHPHHGAAGIAAVLLAGAALALAGAGLGQALAPFAGKWIWG